MPTIDPRIAWPGWETVRLIGRGSFGGVYEIRRDVFGETEKAALKVITIPENDREIEELRDEGYDDESITSTFQTHLKSIVAEYSLMRKLNGHTNVVNCDDVRYVQHENGIGWDIFIKMELLTPMKKAINKSVTEEQTLRIGKDLCRALILCGKHNIIHRDIKPDNIFVSDSGDCKLGDFGIAKTMEKTSGGTKIGTYDYMAPEVYQGKPYGRTADIYSLGMVLYWLLNERRTPYLPLPPKLPTVAEKEEARLRRFGGEALPTPVHGSPALQQIVLKACAYDPKDRYQSAEELLQALESLEDQKAAIAAESIVAPMTFATPNPAEAVEPSPEEAEDATLGANRLQPEPAPEAADEGDVTTNAKWIAMPAEETVLAAPAASTAEDEAEKTVSVFRAAGTAAPIKAEKNSEQRNHPAQPNAFGDPELKQKTTGETGASPTGKDAAVSESVAAEEKKEQPAKKKKRGLLIAALAAILSIAALLVFLLRPPQYGEWSEWDTEKPADVDGRKIETRTEYRYRDSVMQETTDPNAVYGELVEQNEEQQWSEWSDWHRKFGEKYILIEDEDELLEEEIEELLNAEQDLETNEKVTVLEESDTLEIEEELLYRDREVKEKTEYSDWSAWSSWSEASAVSSDTREVETKNAYKYHEFAAICKECGTVIVEDDMIALVGHVYTTHDRKDFDMESNGYVYSETSAYFTIVNTYLMEDTPNAYPSGRSPEGYAIDLPPTQVTLYRVRTRSVEDKTEYSAWSEWRKEPIPEKEGYEVESGTMWRYRTFDTEIVYSFLEWSDWSEWTQEMIEASDTRQVETRTVYRYADQK